MQRTEAPQIGRRSRAVEVLALRTIARVRSSEGVAPSPRGGTKSGGTSCTTSSDWSSQIRSFSSEERRSGR